MRKKKKTVKKKKAAKKPSLKSGELVTMSHTIVRWAYDKTVPLEGGLELPVLDYVHPSDAEWIEEDIADGSARVVIPKGGSVMYMGSKRFDHGDKVECSECKQRVGYHVGSDAKLKSGEFVKVRNLGKKHHILLVEGQMHAIPATKGLLK